MPRPYPRPGDDAWVRDIANLCFTGPDLPSLPSTADDGVDMPNVRLDALYEEILSDFAIDDESATSRTRPNP